MLSAINRLVIPSTLKNTLSIGKTAPVRMGSAELEVAVDSHPKDGVLIASQSQAGLPGVIDGITTNLKADVGRLRLGPVIGVFINSRAIDRIQQGSPPFRLTQLVQANRDVGAILYFFSISDINLPGKEIHGYYYNSEADIWERRRFPLPDVLYDRAGGFVPTQRAVAHFIRGQLKLFGLKMLNAQSYFNKWDTHKQLLRCPSVRPYLLETVLCRRPDDIVSMLLKHGAVYLKSLTGSNGRSVMKLERYDGVYKISCFRREVITRELDDWGDTFSRIRSFFRGRSFVVQAAVDVFTYNGGPVDIRVLVQRGETGKWKFVGRPVRFGVSGSPITSTQSGSEVYDFNDALTILGVDPERAERLRRQIDRLVMAVVTGVEAAYGSFGEIGIDIALDKRLRPYFLECNAKPAKDTIRLLNKPDITREAYARPLQYAKYLAGF